ncbi:hypothetical protein Mapa_018739 [Marchantia paleacea]|nr:hypothetical protein Mapa_018739 [Marchantia paleacea]
MTGFEPATFCTQKTNALPNCATSLNLFFSLSVLYFFFTFFFSLPTYFTYSIYIFFFLKR